MLSTSLSHLTILTLIFLTSLPLALTLQPSLALFTDQACSVPSTTTPNLTLPLNTCAVTVGLESFILDPTPCTSGDVNAWLFEDAACENPSGPLDWYHGAGDNNYCMARYSGAMASVMLTCDDNKDETMPASPATATTTVSVGQVVVAATPTTTTGGGAATTTQTQSSSSEATGGTGTANTNSNSKSGWDSLDYGTRIGIIVAIAVGVPPILIGLWTLKRMYG